MNRVQRTCLATLSAGLLGAVAACSTSSATSSPPVVSASTPAASGAGGVPPKPPVRVTESNPPGDIPDNQAYVAYRPTGAAVSVKVPEGWARSVSGSTTTFTDKLNRIEIAIGKAATAPTTADVTRVDVPRLQSSAPMFVLGKVTSVNLPGGSAVLLTYEMDSPPDQVTGKVVRDKVERYSFFHNGTRLDLSLIGPSSADNVDPWRKVSTSVAWQ